MNFPNIIGFEYSTGNGQLLRATNPQSGSVSEDGYYTASMEDIEKAMVKATGAATVLSRLTSPAKAAFLEKIALNIQQLDEHLVETGKFETGLPEGRILNEKSRTINQIRMFADLLNEGSWVEASIDTAIPDRQPAKPDLRKMLFPIGPVVVFGAANFPLAFSVAGGDTISALAAGNPVIVKAHPAHPGTSRIIGECILDAARETGMPEGTFSMLYDTGFSIGKSLVLHPATRAVGFTGSYQGGKALFDLAMGRPDPIPVFAEMSSVNPVFILPSALKEAGPAIGQAIAASVTLGAGQFCTNPGLVIIHDGPDALPFLNSLSEAIRQSIPQSMLTPAIAAKYSSGYSSMINNRMVSLFSESENTPALNHGKPVVASVSGDYFESDSRLTEEVFGPFSLVVRCSSIEQMVRIAENLNGQLTVSVFHHDAGELESHPGLLDAIRDKAGRLVFNGVPTGVEVCPSMFHGGPFPASTDSRFTSVGTSAIKRWARPVAFQDCPEVLLPSELKSGNPLKIWRIVNSKYSM